VSAEGEPSAARPVESLGPLSEASALKVEALFSGEPAAPAREAGPSLLRIRLLLGLALPFNLLGIPCGIGVPGGILTLWAYLLSDAELVRVEDGLYSDEDAGAFQRARLWAGRMLTLCVISFAVQVVLLMTEPYQAWLTQLLGLLDLPVR
jgi:hypothetical protein